MMISEPTIKALHELNGEFFKMNRYWDATVSILGVTYVCQQSSKLIHEHIAHWYSGMADTMNEKCLENFNVVAYYPATPAGNVTYSNLQDMMVQMLNHTKHFHTFFQGVRKVANENEDYFIVVELDAILRELDEQVAQMILIHDKAMLYKDDYASFDYQFPSFFTLDTSGGTRGV